MPRILIYYDELIMTLAKTYGATMDTRIYSPREIMSSIQGLRPADAVELEREIDTERVKAVWLGTRGKPIEFVPVVRCKDCDNSCPGNHGLVCTIWGAPTEPDAFCSHGERSKEHGDP